MYKLGRARLIELFAESSAPGLVMAQRNLEGTGLQVDDVVLAWMNEFAQSFSN